MNGIVDIPEGILVHQKFKGHRKWETGSTKVSDCSIAQENYLFVNPRYTELMVEENICESCFIYALITGLYMYMYNVLSNTHSSKR